MESVLITNHHGFVYFASPVVTAGSRPIKIGWSTNPWCAVQSGQRFTWFDLEVRAVVPVPIGSLLYGTEFEALEATVHRALRAHRIKREWFTDHEQVLSFLNAAVRGCTAVDLLDLALPLLPDWDRSLAAE